MRILAGLGNPGPRYRGTRHNAGYLVVDALAARWGADFRRLKNADEARARGCVLLKPRTYMNLSGQAVLAALTREGATPGELLVIHDDLDLPLGRLRFRVGGGAGGQRGVQDVIDRLGPGFVRLKVGISRPPPEWAPERWVLSRFQEADLPILDRVVAAAADGVEALLSYGLDGAMNRLNGLDLADGAGADEASGTPGGGPTG
ncbi:MAG TPA: aminoacyl-tRNA hydrolase [Trueperaceae bacterium]|nr:aminoacyl-tRNA hydrolase [Trueperaceae bacterium]